MFDLLDIQFMFLSGSNQIFLEDFIAQLRFVFFSRSNQRELECLNPNSTLQDLQMTKKFHGIICGRYQLFFGIRPTVRLLSAVGTWIQHVPSLPSIQCTSIVCRNLRQNIIGCKKEKSIHRKNEPTQKVYLALRAYIT